MSSALAAACKHPFSNGTEQAAWMDKWCAYCAHDHGMHTNDVDTDQACDIILAYTIEPAAWPSEAWLPEPDDGDFYLPSRMVCSMFQACHGAGCDGDPGAEDRAERVTLVTDYWRQRVWGVTDESD